MRASEAAVVLTYAASLDGRDESRAAASAWADVLDENVTLADAMQIVKEHYAESKWKIMPADINERSREIRRARQDAAIRDHPPVAPPESLDPDDPAQSIGWVRAYWRAIGDGLSPQQADQKACVALNITRPALEAAVRPVNVLIRQAARNTHIPRKDQS